MGRPGTAGSQPGVRVIDPLIMARSGRFRRSVRIWTMAHQARVNWRSGSERRRDAAAVDIPVGLNFFPTNDGPRGEDPHFQGRPSYRRGPAQQES